MNGPLGHEVRGADTAPSLGEQCDPDGGHDEADDQGREPGCQDVREGNRCRHEQEQQAGEGDDAAATR